MTKQIKITAHSNNFSHEQVMVTYYTNGELDNSTRTPVTGHFNAVVKRYNDLGYKVEAIKNTERRKNNRRFY